MLDHDLTGTVVFQESRTQGSQHQHLVYFLNGVATTQANFESALSDIKAGTKSGTVIEDTTGTNHNHRLNTAAP